MVRKLLYCLLVGVSAFLIPNGASAGWPPGLMVVLHNCQNSEIKPDIRISACDSLIHSNIVGGKMLAAFYALRAQAYIAAKDDERAIQDYDKALELFPDYPEVLVSRGTLFARAGQHERALADYGHAIQVAPEDAYAWRTRCKEYLFLSKDMDAALADCNEAVRLKPGNAEELMLRAEVYAKLGRCTEAKADFDAAVRADPSQAQETSELSTCHAGIGGASDGG